MKIQLLPQSKHSPLRLYKPVSYREIHVKALHVCPSVFAPVHLEKLGFHWKDFHEDASKICQENSSLIKN